MQSSEEAFASLRTASAVLSIVEEKKIVYSDRLGHSGQSNELFTRASSDESLFDCVLGNMSKPDVAVMMKSLSDTKLTVEASMEI